MCLLRQDGYEVVTAGQLGSIVCLQIGVLLGLTSSARVHMQRLLLAHHAAEA